MAEQDRQALAAEILEMGEQLFAFALEGQASQQANEEDEEHIFPIAEIAAASGEFFIALCLLIGIKEK